MVLEWELDLCYESLWSLHSAMKQQETTYPQTCFETLSDKLNKTANYQLTNYCVTNSVDSKLTLHLLRENYVPKHA